MASATQLAVEMFTPSSLLSAIDLAPGAVISVQGRKGALTVVEVVELSTVVCATKTGKRLELMEMAGDWYRVARKGSAVPWRPIVQPTVIKSTPSMLTL